MQARARGGDGEDEEPDQDVYDGDRDGLSEDTASFLQEHGINIAELLGDEEDAAGTAGLDDSGQAPWPDERLDVPLFAHDNCRYTVRQFAHALLQVKVGCTGFNDTAADKVCKLFKEVFAGSAQYNGPGCEAAPECVCISGMSTVLTHPGCPVARREVRCTVTAPRPSHRQADWLQEHSRAQVRERRASCSGLRAACLPRAALL